MDYDTAANNTSVNFLEGSCAWKLEEFHLNGCKCQRRKDLSAGLFTKVLNDSDVFTDRGNVT